MLGTAENVNAIVRATRPRRYRLAKAPLARRIPRGTDRRADRRCARLHYAYCSSQGVATASASGAATPPVLTPLLVLGESTSAGLWGRRRIRRRWFHAKAPLSSAHGVGVCPVSLRRRAVRLKSRLRQAPRRRRPSALRSSERQPSLRAWLPSTPLGTERRVRAPRVRPWVYAEHPARDCVAIAPTPSGLLEAIRADPAPSGEVPGRRRTRSVTSRGRGVSRLPGQCFAHVEQGNRRETNRRDCQWPSSRDCDGPLSVQALPTLVEISHGDRRRSRSARGCPDRRGTSVTILTG